MRHKVTPWTDREDPKMYGNKLYLILVVLRSFNIQERHRILVYTGTWWWHRLICGVSSGRSRQLHQVLGDRKQPESAWIRAIPAREAVTDYACPRANEVPWFFGEWTHLEVVFSFQDYEYYLTCSEIFSHCYRWPQAMSATYSASAS